MWIASSSALVIAVVDGKFVSVYDGRTEYVLSKWTFAGSGTQEGWPGFWSCLHAYPSLEQAKAAVFPGSSKHKKGARVLVRVTARGKGFYHPDEDRFAVSGLRTEEILEYVPAGPKPGYLPLACVNSPEGLQTAA